MDSKKVGNFIAILRKRENMTQEDLAEKIGVSSKTISKWERGLNFPDTIWLCKMSDIFKVSVQDILNGSIIKDSQTNNKVLLSFINLYRKKSKKKLIVLLSLVLIFFVFLFSILYTLNNYNKNSAFSITSDDSSFLVSGYVIFNQNEELFILDSITFNDTVLGTDLEPIVKNLSITLRNKNEIFYSSEIITDSGYNGKLSNVLKNSKISFSEGNDRKSIITKHDLKNIYLIVSYIDVNGVEFNKKIKLKFIEEFSNNKLFY